jgi:hypothetical protein
MLSIENKIDNITFNTINGKLILSNKTIIVIYNSYVIKIEEPFKNNFYYTLFNVSLLNDNFTYKNNYLNQENYKGLFTYVKNDNSLLINYGKSDSMKIINIVKLNYQLQIFNWVFTNIKNESIEITHKELPNIFFYYNYNNESNYFPEFYDYGVIYKKDLYSYNINIKWDNDQQNIYLINKNHKSSKQYLITQNTLQIIEHEDRKKSITYFFIKKANLLKFKNAVLIINNINYREKHVLFKQKYSINISDFQWQCIINYFDLRSIYLELENFMENFKQTNNLICHKFLQIGPLNF